MSVSETHCALAIATLLTGWTDTQASARYLRYRVAQSDVSLVWRRWRRSGQVQAQGGWRLAGGSRVDPCVRDEAEDLG